MQLEIIYKDEHLVAINKPHGLFVHRTGLATYAGQYALQELRNQIGHYVFPCHRIDRKTSGVLLFALNSATNREMMNLFSKGAIRKKYLAIVRGFTPDEGLIDYPLKRHARNEQQAQTRYTTIDKSEIFLTFGKFSTSRYSLVKVEPLTGRMHQIRKHFAHIFHPIIGDRPYGCNKQNRLFKEKWGITSLMLHAYSLEFDHPADNRKISITAKPSTTFTNTCETLGFFTHFAILEAVW